MIEWLDGASQELLNWLERVMDWRHSLQLSGSEKIYDPILGCYGNPNARVVFVAEIPEVSGIDQAIADLRDRKQTLDTLWQSNWKVSEGDRLFRKALVENNNLIPDIENNNPADWRCWITDFVKCPTRNDFWRRHIDPARKKDILQKSAELLAEEIGMVERDKVVMMGRVVEGYFRTYRNVLGIVPEKLRFVPHYARKNGKEQGTKYRRDFRKGLGRRKYDDNWRKL